MNRRILGVALSLAVVLGLGGCRWEPGGPSQSPWLLTALRIEAAQEGAQTRGPASTAMRCNLQATRCEPLTEGEQFPAPCTIVTTGGHRASIALSPTGTLDLGPDSSVTLQPGPVATVQLRRGRATLHQRAATSAEAPANEPVTLGLVDRTVLFDETASTIVAAHLLAPGRAAVTVRRGRATLQGGHDATLALRAGESVHLVTGQPPDRRGMWTGQLAAVRPVRWLAHSGEGAIDRPRGLGRMTARIPGTDRVVAGVRLVAHHVSVAVREGYARTEVVEEFFNETDRVLEGRYVFPIPAGASISRLALWVGKELVEGEMLERERAARIFKGIVDDTVRPRDPALLEWVTGGEFSLKIFPIPPRSSRRVLLAYNQGLSTEAGPDGRPRVRYVYPLSLGSDRATPIDDFSIDVAVRDTRPGLTNLRTGHYPAMVHAHGQEARARYHAQGFTPTTDFVVSYSVNPAEQVQTAVYDPAWARRGGAMLAEVSAGAEESIYAAFRLTAALPEGLSAPTFTPLDRAIVIDTSHSQCAETLAAQRTIASGLLRNMDHDERFSVLACDSACVSFPPEGLLPAQAKTVAAAERWLAKLGLGGASDVAGALLEASRRLGTGRADQLVYLGDGSATAGELSVQAMAQRIAPVVKQRGIDLRLFGVGRSVDEVVLRGLARGVGAVYERVGKGQSLAAQIDDIAMGLRQPVIVAPELELPDSVVDVHPRRLPNLRLGQEVRVVGKLRAHRGGSVALRGQLGGQSYRLAKTLRWQDDPKRHNPLVPRLWAEARIAELEGSRNADAVAEAIRLSKRHHVMSRHTALLVLENDRMFAEFGIERTQRRHRQRTDGAADELDSREGGTASRAPVAPWGRDDSFGSDPLSARGTMWGSGARDGFGPEGLGLAGIGDGGGGRGEGIGLGSVGTIGHGLGTGVGQGFGSGATSAADRSGSVGVVGSGLSSAAAGPRSGHSFGAGSGPLGASPPRAPRVRMGMTSVSGRLPPEVIQRIVRQNFGRFRLCYENALRTNPQLSGRVVVRFVIGRDGMVSNVGGGGDVPDAGMISCVTRAFYGLSFPQPEGGIVTVTYPIVFTPTRDSASRASTLDGGQRATSLRPNQSTKWLVTMPSVPPPAPPMTKVFEEVIHHACGDEWRHGDEPAVEELRDRVRLHPQSRAAHEALVRGLLVRGRFEAALVAANRFATVDPDLPLARELLAQAAAAMGEGELAVAALASQVESTKGTPAAHQRIARAYEVLGHARRACAHWRAAAELEPSNDRAQYESLRCRARVFGETSEALAAARTIAKPGKLVEELIGLLEAGRVPDYDGATDGPGWFEAKVQCQPGASCPTVVVVAPGGRIYSPWSPAAARSGPRSVAFGQWGWGWGTYRTLLVGGGPGARGELALRAGNKVKTLRFEHDGGIQTIAATHARSPYRRWVRF